MCDIKAKMCVEIKFKETGYELEYHCDGVDKNNMYGPALCFAHSSLFATEKYTIQENKEAMFKYLVSVIDSIQNAVWHLIENSPRLLSSPLVVS